MITDQPGPYLVKLFRSLPLDDQLNKTDWVKGAQVSIVDDQGADEALIEVNPGNYQTVSIQGVVGRTYHIHISTEEGAMYESIPEKLLAVGDINNLHSQFEQKVSPLYLDHSNPP